MVAKVIPRSSELVSLVEGEPPFPICLGQHPRNDSYRPNVGHVLIYDPINHLAHEKEYAN